MDLFKAISDMKFGEAYNELATIAFTESKQFIAEKKEAIQHPQSTSITDEENELREPLRFG